MAIPQTQSTQMPLRSPTPLIAHSSPFIHFRSLFFTPHRRPLYPIKHFCSLRTSTNNATTSDNRNRYPWDDNSNDDGPQNPTKNPNRSSSSVKTKPASSSSSWIKKWPSNNPSVESNSKQSDERVESRVFDGKSTGTAGENAIQRIVLRLRNLGLGSDDEEEEEEEEGEGNTPAMPVTGDEKLGDLLSRDWVRPDKMLDEDEDEESLLPWERRVEVSERQGIEEEVKKKRTASAPTLAELTIEDSELRRLRREGMTLRERISVAKAGVTGAVLEKIHDKWRRSELVRLKFHETLAHDMKTAHEIVERRTGGLITWRAGSVMVVYRGSNYNGPSQRPKPVDGEGDSLFVPDVSNADNTIDNSVSDSPSLEEKNKVLIADRVKILTEEEVECNRVLDSLGPRFEDWWGTGILPVDADKLPPKVPGFKTPFRLLPTGMRSRLTNAELTNLRKLARSLPCHFALGRNRNHQGLAEAIIKLWEKSLVVKIAVKRGIQNTNNKLMADEIKDLTGGILLLRNKFFIVIYRGKDFVPTTVATALAERQEITKQIQDTEEKVRSGTVKVVPPVESKQAQAGTLAEFYEAQARWGKEVSNEEREKMIEEASKIENAKKFKKIEHKLSIARSKLLRAEKMLSKVEASMIPVGPSDDQETITEEERSMFRRVGLRMKAYLPMGIRGVFDGVIENMHLHWKHRELVKLISKQKNPAFIEETARLLEYESGGILVAIERVPKGHALIYYRGKNYRRPISLRPRNLLTKAKALKRSVALQRHEALSQHISEVENTIEQMKLELGYDEDVEEENSGDTDKFKQASELDESEDEWINSDDEDDDDDSEDEESLSLGLDDYDYPPGRRI